MTNCDWLTTEQEARLEAIYQEIDILNAYLADREKSGEFHPAAYLELDRLYREVKAIRDEPGS